ncbi:E3 ubiquitin-protein ligase TRIM37-like [Anopheles stephensi]|uniref:E3 ubiquitin-protein ligase TRIM37-like n=1 Tax=Anopheles stephensi TaxID=30069 RepID=UPI0016587D77|nr:E3 ubiquitin-protein ligase TRIM37-like [Anopheles stephensi]XP_035895647.1 E3 ubiquitin-protein ligase TRIM37-like [Anopheles stephensi]
MASGSDDQLGQCSSATLQCLICMKHIEDPRLCPQCSKLFCYNCIRQWLQKADSESGNPTCPYCRCTCNIETFVKILEGSPLYPCNPIAEESSSTAHPDTANNDPEKVLHRLEKLLLETQGFFNETNDRVNQELKKHSALVEKTKNNLVKTVNLMTHQELKDIHQQFHAKNAEIDAWNEILKNKLNKHQFDVSSIKAAIQQSSPAELVVKQAEIEKSCTKVTESLKSISLNVKPLSFTSNLIPEPFTWKFAVNRYTAIRRTNEVQYSDLVTDDIGSVWRLEVHPCGFDDAKNTSLSIFLQLYNGIEGQYHYSFELLGPTRNHFYEAEDYFELRKGWGQNHFIDLKSLQESFIVDDGFELRCSVRSLNLIDKYGKMKKRADLLTTEVDHLKKLAYPDCLDEVVTIRNVVEAVKSSACLYSDILSDDIGGQWRLQVYPGGNGETRGQFLCIFLELCSGIPNKYEFTVALLHQNVKKIVKKSLEYCIQPSLPFGWKTFLGREEFINSGYIQKDSLSIRLTVKPPNATQKLAYFRQQMEHNLEHNEHPTRKQSVISNDSKPSTSQEPLERRLRKASISLYKNLFTKSSSTDQ